MTLTSKGQDMIQAYLDFLVVEKGLSANSIAAYAADISRFLEFLKSREIELLEHVDITVILAWLVQLPGKAWPRNPVPGT